jgi:hypothetical protein
LAKTSTRRAIFDSPVTLPSLAGDVADVGDPVEGHEVVLTGGVDLDVAHDDHLVVVDVEGRREHLRRVLVADPAKNSA